MSSVCERLKKSLEVESTVGAYESELLERNIGDKRLNQRAEIISSLFENNPGKSIPQISETKAILKSIYRFLGNDKVTMESLIEPHIKNIPNMVGNQEILFSIQDTSTIDFTGRKSIQGIGNHGNDIAKGYIIHPTLITTTHGVSLGYADYQCWTRKKEDKSKKTDTEKRKENRKKAIEEKESNKWINSFNATCELQKNLNNKVHFVCIADRESDIYEFFLKREEYYQEEGYAPDLLLRAKQNRKVKDEEDRKQLLWDSVKSAPISGEINIVVPKQKDKKEREACLTVQYCKITMLRPKEFDKQRYKPITVYAVYTNEINPPKDVEPVSWLLLTTISVDSFDNALLIIQAYLKRWVIETLFKVLKSCCKTEERQLRYGDGLKKTIVLDSIVAWKILFMTMLGRAFPDLPASVIFEDYEWQALHVLTYKTTEIPTTIPSLGMVTLQIAKLGGFIERKNKKIQPGPLIMFRGFDKLLNAIPMFIIYNHKRNGT